MNCDLIIHGGNIVTPDGTSKADIAIANGKILSIGQQSSMLKAARQIDATGRYVMAGIIDPHAHLGYMDTLEAVETETRAAAPKAWVASARDVPARRGDSRRA